MYTISTCHAYKIIDDRLAIQVCFETERIGIEIVSAGQAIDGIEWTFSTASEFNEKFKEVSDKLEKLALTN